MLSLRCALSLTYSRGGRDRRSLLPLGSARVRSFPRAPLSFLLEVAAQHGTPSAPFPPARLLSPLSSFSGAHQCSSVHPLLSHFSCTGKLLSLLGHLLLRSSSRMLLDCSSLLLKTTTLPTLLGGALLPPPRQRRKKSVSVHIAACFSGCRNSGKFFEKNSGSRLEVGTFGTEHFFLEIQCNERFWVT